MKRLTLLAAALVMVLGFAVSASAAPEVTVSGNILINAVWMDNWGFNDGQANNDTDEEFNIRERFDLAFTAVANENLKAVIVLRSAREEWGDNGYEVGQTGGSGYNGAANSVGVGVNQAYIDFNWPGTPVNVKAGYMPVALPASVGGGSMIMDDTAAGVLTTTAFNDNVALLAGWLRLVEPGNNGTFGADAGSDVYVDAWVAALPLTFEGVSLTPFVVVAGVGGNTTAANVIAMNNDPNRGLRSARAAAGDSIDGAWWAGSNFELSMLDPFIIKADLNYGSVDGDNNADRSGWLFDIALDYTGFDFMNLELAYAYTSGLDDDANDGDDRMPTLIDSWSLGSTFFGGGLITGDDMGNADNIGFHAIALSATGIQSFLEGLTHDAHIVYAWGTNEESAANAAYLPYANALLEDDTMLEIDFNSFYKIYDELTLYNGIGYVNLDKDDGANAWGANNDGGDAWKFQVGLKYVF
jgi:hypothetical protein